MISDLFFGVKPKIGDEFIFDLKVVFALTSIPNFNEIAMILFIPSKVFAQGIDFIFNILNFALCFFDFIDDFF